jgi:hypothetical protein
MNDERHKLLRSGLYHSRRGQRWRNEPQPVYPPFPSAALVVIPTPHPVRVAGLFLCSVVQLALGVLSFTCDGDVSLQQYRCRSYLLPSLLILVFEKMEAMDVLLAKKSTAPRPQLTLEEVRIRCVEVGGHLRSTFFSG